MSEGMHDGVFAAPVDEAKPVEEAQPAETAKPVEAAKPAAEKKPAAPLVVMSSRIKQVVKGQGMRSAGQLAEAVNAKVLEIIERAVEHAKAEGRATVRPQDVLAA